jgi:hypothetical protein
VQQLHHALVVLLGGEMNRLRPRNFSGLRHGIAAFGGQRRQKRTEKNKTLFQVNFLMKSAFKIAGANGMILWQHPKLPPESSHTEKSRHEAGTIFFLLVWTKTF